MKGWIGELIWRDAQRNGQIKGWIMDWRYEVKVKIKGRETVGADWRDRWDTDWRASHLLCTVGHSN
jgi:hypothetical protein